MPEKPTYEELVKRIQELEQEVSDLSEANSKLTDNESRLREAHKLLQLGIWSWDVNSGKVEWSEEVFKLFRLNPKEFSPNIDSILELSPWPDHQQRDKELIQKATKSREAGSYEQKFLRPDGSIGYYVSSFKGVYDDSGDLIKINGTVQDITKQKASEEALLRSEEKHRLAMEATLDGIWDWHIETGEVDYSKNWQKILGEESVKPNYEFWESRIHPDDKTDVLLSIEKHLKGKTSSWSKEHRLRTKKGEWKWVLGRGRVVEKSSEGLPLRMIGTMTDISDLKQAEEELNRIFELSPDLIGVGNLTEGYYKRVNPAYKIFGLPLDEFLSRPYIDFIHPDDHYPTANIVRTMQSGQHISGFVNRYRCKDGSYRTIEWRATPTEADGTTYVAGRDITDREKTEKALRESEERFALAMEFANDGLFDWNLETNEIYFSPVWKRLLGYEDDELPNDFSIWEKLTEPEDVKRSWEMQNELINKKRDRFEIEFKMRHKNGHWVDILSRANAIFNENNKAIRIIGTHVDITEKKKAEKEIKKQKERAERYLNLAGVIFIALNRNGEVTLINKKGCETLGCNYSEVIGKNWFENFIPEWLRDDLLPISKQLLNGDTEPVEYYENPILTKNGEEKLIAWHNTILMDETGDIIGHLSAGEDITEKRRMEEQLKQAQKMESIGTLAGGIAHEFNNILSIIIGNNELIMEDLPEWSLSRESCEEIRVAGIRARDIVKHLLTFSRQDDSTKKPIDIVSVTKEALKLIRATTPSNIEIRERISSDCLPIFGDATQIHQILINLCNNAVDALPVSGGRIYIELYNSNIAKSNASPYSTLSPGKYIRLLVQDNGTGMDTKTMERVFEPYFTTKDVGKGSGIGLAVVHGIIENHGGSIDCESAKGEGTTFTILLPAHEGFVEEEREQAIPFPGKGECVLYVDDEPSIAKLGKRHLEALGYDAFSATDPNEALEMIKAEPDRFDLVISDMAMPNIPGDQLIAEILSINPDMPTMICSGYSSRMSETKASEMGIKAFVMKPLNKNELAKKVREVLDSSKPS